MATVTLTGNTNYSALTLANDDDIDLAGFILTLDIQPTETGIQVISPGTNGRVVFSGAWVIPTWDFFAGTTPLIVTLPENAVIGSITGGTTANSRGISTNNGEVGIATGGSADNCHGILTNEGIVGTAISGSGTAAHGVNTNGLTGYIATGIHGGYANTLVVSTNNGTIGEVTAGPNSGNHGVSTNSGRVGTANGGSASGAHGISTNNGYVENAVGGSVNGAYGVSTQRGIVALATGGFTSTAYGVSINETGHVTFRFQDNTAAAVNIMSGSTALLDGPKVNGVVPSNIKFIYSFGPLSVDATIASDAVVVELPPIGGGSANRAGIRVPSFAIGPGA